MIDYSKVLSRERIERMREIAERGDYCVAEAANGAILALIEHAKVFDMALQSLTPMGSEYVNDPERCVERVREIRETHHRVITNLVRQLRDAGLPAHT